MAGDLLRLTVQFVAPAYYDDAVSITVVYLDICALKRPFDDARSERIRREAEAVARIFEEAENGRLELVVSPAHRFENDRNPREDRRLATSLWLQKAGRTIDAASAADERARFLNGLGFGHSMRCISLSPRPRKRAGSSRRTTV